MASHELVVRRGTEADAFELYATMRKEDVAELRATGLSPLGGLLDSVRQSDQPMAVVVGESVAAMFGVAPVDILSGVGAVWMLSGYAVDMASPLVFLRRCRAELEQLLARWPKLINAIDARYVRSVRWARWLGFDVSEPFPHGIAGVPFHFIEARRA